MRIVIARDENRVVITAYEGMQPVRTATLTGENAGNLEVVRTVAEEVARLAHLEIKKFRELEEGFRAIEKELSND